MVNRRHLLSAIPLAAGAPLLNAAQGGRERSTRSIPGVVPISDDERRSRIEKARRLMAANKIEAIVLEPGTSMLYFTGTRWGRSERTFALVIPARGELAYVVPGFEEGRAREVTKFTSDIRVWQEDESPYERIVQVLHDR